MKYEGSNLQSALKYVAQRFPILAGDSVDNRQYLSRRPFNTRSLWPTEATTDPATVAAWFLRSPFANIILPLGKKSGVIAVRAEGEVGMDTLERWMDERGWFPETLSCEVGETRFSLFGAGDLRVGSEVQLGPGVVACGDGAHILLPPSRRDDTEYVTWDDPDDPITAFPEWLKRLIVESTEAAA